MAFQLKDFDTIKNDFINKLKFYVEENSGISITDFNVGSIANNLIEASSDVLEDLYYQMLQVAKDGLENIYNGFNFYKIPGKRSLTTVFVYVTGANGISDVNNSTFFSIPKGSTFSTDDGAIEFSAIEDYSPSKLSIASSGEFSGKVVYQVKAQCKTIGLSGNIQQNSLTKITSTITNTNNYSIAVRCNSGSGGFDEETEAAMKLRFQKYLISLRRGTKEAIEFALDTNANFTGLVYNIDSFTPLIILGQDELTVGTETYTDLTFENKFSDVYFLFKFLDSESTTNNVRYIHYGYPERFNSLLTVTKTVSGDARVKAVKYWNGSAWVAVTSQSPASTTAFAVDQFITWTIADPLLWVKTTISGYNGYFVQIEYDDASSTYDSSAEVIKAMTYPFPGYINIYCLKNYREVLSSLDKEFVAEAVENYKAAGIITSVTNASIVALRPTVIIYSSSPQVQALWPSTLSDDIKNDILEYSKTLGVSKDFNRNDLYTTLYQKYNSYGSIFIYYDYDAALASNNERYSSVSVFDAAKNEKIDFAFADVYILPSLLSLEAIILNAPTATGPDWDTNYGNIVFA